MRRLSLWMNLPTTHLGPTPVVSVSVSVSATSESSPKAPKKGCLKLVDPAAPEKSQPMQERYQEASCSDPDSSQPLEIDQQGASCRLQVILRWDQICLGVYVQDLYSYPS